MAVRRTTPFKTASVSRIEATKAQSFQVESIAVYNFLMEHDPWGRARGHAFRKTGIPLGSSPRAGIFRIIL
jgi:hypothetical protein